MSGLEGTLCAQIVYHKGNLPLPYTNPSLNLCMRWVFVYTSFQFMRNGTSILLLKSWFSVYEKQFFPENWEGCFLTEMNVVHITCTADYELKIHLSAYFIDLQRACILLKIPSSLKLIFSSLLISINLRNMLRSSRVTCNRVELHVSLERNNVPCYLLDISDVQCCEDVKLK